MKDIRNYYMLLEHQTRMHPEKLFLQIDEKYINYQEMLQRVDEFASTMPLNISGNILVLAEDFFGQAAAFLALQKRNLRPILLHHGLSAQEQSEILRENSLQGILSVGKDGISFRGTGLPLQEHIEADILGVLSSGSTGVPKVMYRTYGSWADFFPVQNEIFMVDGETRMFLHGSLSFTGNLNSFLSVLYEGGSIITSRSMHHHQWESLLRKAAVNVIYLVPAKLQILVETIREPVNGVRSIFTGSQLLSGHVLERLMHIFAQSKIFLYYGASELNYITYALCDDPKRNPANLGKPFPGIRLSVKDGLVYVDTPYHVSGIEIPFTVKDTGCLNEKGELIFRGRREAWINKGGVKISITRIENALLKVPGIREAAVLRCKDDRRGDDLAAFLVKYPDAGEREIRQSLRRHLKAVEVPSYVFFLKELPLNDRGKIDQKALEGWMGEITKAVAS